MSRKIAPAPVVESRVVEDFSDCQTMTDSQAEAGGKKDGLTMQLLFR